MGGVDQVEHLHLITILTKQLRHIVIHFRFRVTDDRRLTSADHGEQRIPDYCTGFHGTAGTEDRTVSVESGVLRKTDQLTLALTQDHTGCLVCGAELQHRFEFLLCHPACRAVGTCFADHESTLIIMGSREFIVESDIQVNACDRSKQERHALEAIPGESFQEAYKRVPARC